MAFNVPYDAWTFTDLQSRYERAQLLTNDCTQDFAGNYFFPSDRSPKGYWTTTRRQVLDYVCDCPDFGRTIEQQITNFAPSRWVRGDWAVRPDNRILVNRCLHCFAVAIAEQELDPAFPVNRIYQVKRERYPKTDCGCGCGGSGGCGCPNKELGLPEPKLIQGCDTDCYVEPLTPRTLRTPSTAEGVPGYQTFQLSEIQFSQTKFRSCSDRTITITLERNTSQGWNNATVSGLKDAIEFPFQPEFKTSSIAVDLTGNFAGVYLLGITAIASGNFGERTEAELTIVDCSPLNPDLPQCVADEFLSFGGGECEGSFLVANYTTGNTNPDGTCEIIKVRQFQEGLDCPLPPDPPPKECESTIPRDCPVISPDAPICVQGSGFNAIVKVQNGKKETEYLRPDKKECAEYCQFENRTDTISSCPPEPKKPVPAPFCPIPVNRYTGWVKESTYLVSAFVNGISPKDSFTCDDGTRYYLLGYNAKCMPPVNRYLDSFAAGNYQGNEFGEGCCPFDETKPPRPACPVISPVLITKWKCQDGICIQDPNGVYASQAECQAALIPPPFMGGQDPSYSKYKIKYHYVDNFGVPGLFETGFTYQGTIYAPAYGLGAIGFTFNSGASFLPLVSSTYYSFVSIEIFRNDGQPDINLPSTCP
jgi:hypothetical protein